MVGCSRISCTYRFFFFGSISAMQFIQR
ncbi:hypothetical protein CFP56_023403 [Quercus suber]|uniref:Uncharacterized protein n=1 Tax=Quercus suber TaxID=58331 RepID=A0AAW0KAJ6_QUESU